MIVLLQYQIYYLAEIIIIRSIDGVLHSSGPPELSNIVIGGVDSQA
jgi:hypothetical protein